MANRRRLFRKIKLVLESDDALEWPSFDGAPTYADYVERGWLWKDLCFAPGKENDATVWHLMPMTWPQREHFRSFEQSDIEDRMRFVLRCCLRKIDNYVQAYEDEDGGLTEKPLPELRYVEDSRFGDLVAEEWFAEANLLLSELMAVAMAATQISETSIPFSKGSATPSGRTSGGSNEG